MKKLFLTLMSVVAMTAFVSCDDKPVAADKLPAKAKTFLETYFPGIEVVSVVKESDGDYDVRLWDGTEIDFKSNGAWKKVDCNDRPVPVGFYPENITTYVATNYPGHFIEEIEFEHNRYKVGLSVLGVDTDVDLLFDKSGDFIGLDD